MRPEFSVVVPAYNAERFLPRTLDSVVAQTVNEWEVVVVDDASTDATASVAAGYAARDPRIRVVSLPTNAGPGGAVYDKGLAATSGSPYVMFLDADDMLERDALATLRKALDARPSSLGAHGIPIFVDADDRPLDNPPTSSWLRRRGIAGRRLVTWPEDAPTTFAVLAFTNQIVSLGLVLLRRTAIEAVGGFDPTLRFSEDWDLLLRVSRHGDLAFVPKVVLRYRRHPGQLTTWGSRGNAAWRRADRQMRRGLMLAADNTPEQRRVVRWGQWHAAWEPLRWARGEVSEGHLLLGARYAQRGLRNAAALGVDLAASLRN